MKKILLCSAAVAGVAFAAAPAMAQVDVTVGGHTKNYIGWTSQDDDTAEVNNFDMLRESEIHFNAEGTADNGLTYGFHVESEVDGEDDFAVEESYLYLASNLGRVNLGSEDGANYLLQVAAPSADANVDGLRQYIQPLRFSADGLTDGAVDYDNDLTGQAEKITYLSPNWNGFQFGLSYTPEVTDDIDTLDGLAGFSLEEVGLSEGYDAAVRYEGTFNNIGFAVGAGYTHVENDSTTVGADDDLEEWNLGADFDIGAFGIGAVYTESSDVSDDDTDTMVLGGDYTTGPFQFGASYYNRDTDGGTELDRYTGGVVYTMTQGLTLRGSISYTDVDVPAADDFDGTAVLGGIQFNF